MVRSHALGRPGNPTGGHYDPSARSSLDWDWHTASSQEARTRGLCLWRKPETRSRQWSAEWRARRSQDARPPQGGRLMVAPPGAPFPSLFARDGREDGVPGAAKNTGDDSCLIETCLIETCLIETCLIETCLIETWLFENTDRGWNARPGRQKKINPARASIRCCA